MNSTFELLHSSRETLKSSRALLVRSAFVIRDSRALIKATCDRVERSRELAHAPLPWLSLTAGGKAPSIAAAPIR